MALVNIAILPNSVFAPVLMLFLHYCWVTDYPLALGKITTVMLVQY